MLPLGHLGIGSKIVSPFSRNLPLKMVLLGTLAPDIIDKTLYYGLSIATGLKGKDLGLISGTRTFGHTGLILILLTAICWIRKSKILAALVLGISSHLFLDSLSDYFLGNRDSFELSYPLLWPLSGWSFPTIRYRDTQEYLSVATQPFMVWSEIIGFIFLILEFKKHRTR